MGINTLLAFIGRIFNGAGFMGNVQQVVIFTIRLGCGLLSRDTMLFSIPKKIGSSFEGI